jgi:VanZ family protein
MRQTGRKWPDLGLRFDRLSRQERPHDLFFRAAALGLATIIAVLSLLPISGEASIAHADKIQHLLAYGALAGLIGLGWPGQKLFKVFLIASLFGLGVEIAQALAPTGRTLSGLDMLANMAGAALATFTLQSVRRR